MNAPGGRVVVEAGKIMREKLSEAEVSAVDHLQPDTSGDSVTSSRRCEILLFVTLSQWVIEHNLSMRG